MVKLRDWRLVEHNGAPCLTGRAIRHPKLGTCRVRTSPIISAAPPGLFLTRSGTLYRLVGDPAPGQSEIVQMPQKARDWRSGDDVPPVDP